MSLIVSVIGAVRFGIVIRVHFLASASRYRHLGSQFRCVFGEAFWYRCLGSRSMFVLGEGCSCSVVCRCFVEIVEPNLLLAVVA